MMTNNDSAFASEWSDEKFLDQIDQAHEYATSYQELANRLEWVALNRMLDRGATAIPSSKFVCEKKVEVTYDQTRFIPLKEIFKEDLVKCWTPAHQETIMVPEKWDTTKLKALARRYGNEALAIVESARTENPTGIKFERKDHE